MAISISQDDLSAIEQHYGPKTFQRGLAYASQERVRLVKLAPGTRLEPHEHPGGEEILVLDGAFEDERGSYPKGTWLRNPPGSAHGAFSEGGCTLYVKTGHLLAGSRS